MYTNHCFRLESNSTKRGKAGRGKAGRGFIKAVRFLIEECVRRREKSCYCDVYIRFRKSIDRYVGTTCGIGGEMGVRGVGGGGVNVTCTPLPARDLVVWSSGRVMN